MLQSILVFVFFNKILMVIFQCNVANVWLSLDFEIFDEKMHIFKSVFLFYEHIIEQFPEQDLYCCYTYSFKDVSLVEIFQYHLVHDVLCKFLVFVTWKQDI